MTFANTEQAEAWNEIALGWVALESELERMTAPPGRLAIERLGLTGGERVIDLGCGTGGTAIALSQLVGPEGSVLGVDIAQPMIERARVRAAEAGAGNVEFRLADVQVGELGEGEADAAFSRFGVMFFDDPVAAFTNVRQALRSGGRLSFVCWQAVFENDWATVPGMAAISVLGQAPELPDASTPGPWAFADPDLVRSILSDAGWSDVDVLAHSEVLQLPEGDIPSMGRTSLNSGIVRRALEGQSDEVRDAVAAAIGHALEERVSGGVVPLKWSVNLVTAAA